MKKLIKKKKKIKIIKKKIQKKMKNIILMNIFMKEHYQMSMCMIKRIIWDIIIMKKNIVIIIKAIINIIFMDTKLTIIITQLINIHKLMFFKNRLKEIKYKIY